MPALFVFTITGPSGTSLSAKFELVPDQQYRPAGVVVLTTPPSVPGARMLNVASQRLPDPGDFRVMAAVAATRAAREPRNAQDEVNRMLFPLG